MLIDYQKIASAISHYKALGFTPVDVHQGVATYIDDLTRSKKLDQINLSWYPDLNLISSTEQGVLEMLYNDTLTPGLYQATAMCFKNQEGVKLLDEWSFLTTQLIDNTIQNASDKDCNEALRRMLRTAHALFLNYHPDCRIVNFDNKYKIMLGSIALGTYGIRNLPLAKYVYGTGISEPRLTTAIKLHNFESTSKS